MKRTNVDKAKAAPTRFVGLLAGKTAKVATLRELSTAAVAGWAGQEQEPALTPTSS